MTLTPIFGGPNYANIANDPNFKEESVRIEIIEPILKRLGYRRENILRNRPLLAQVGTKKREMSIPDYILAIGQYNAFVLEAKAPNQVIKGCPYPTRMRLSITRLNTKTLAIRLIKPARTMLTNDSINKCT